MEVNYPPPETIGTRRLRRWVVDLQSEGPTEADARGVAEAIVVLLKAQREAVFVSLGRDLAVLAPAVALHRTGVKSFEVVVEYEPAGFVGDCEIMCLWTPIQVLDAVWGVEQLNKVSRAQWLPFI